MNMWRKNNNEDKTVEGLTRADIDKSKKIFNP